MSGDAVRASSPTEASLAAYWPRPWSAEDGDALEPLWRLDGFAHAGHIVLYPDTRELIVTDWRGPGNPANPIARAAARGGHAVPGPGGTDATCRRAPARWR